jgi:kynurenine formamidase
VGPSDQKEVTMKRLSTVGIALAIVIGGIAAGPAAAQRDKGLWSVYNDGLRGAKYIDLTHTLTPRIPVWKGFGPSVFSPSLNPETGAPYSYASDGFEATSYRLSTDQFGTQLDPPAHWAPEYAAIDELPATFAVRPLVVISIVPQVKRDFNYHLRVSDIRRFERRHGRIPRGALVAMNSGWDAKVGDDDAFKGTDAGGTYHFPGFGEEAADFLLEERRAAAIGGDTISLNTSRRPPSPRT